MSAIVGIYQNIVSPSIREQGSRMLEALSKFPADDVQAWERHERVVLGCHAQWITPESVGERNPLWDEERRLAITADAIIDNRDELFDRLQIENHLRREMTDANLILLAYERWGTECPKYLVGDFAYIIWDERNELLYAARDFAGSRTLYYSLSPDKSSCAFATMMAPLLTLPYTDAGLNEQWIAEFLSVPATFDTVECSTSVHKGILQVPPAHSITIGRNMQPRIERYIDLASEDRKLRLRSNAEYEEALRSVLNEAVTSHIRTHRRVGSHLSGGLDSGSVASFASRALKLQNKPLYTYSYVPVEDFQDWTPRSRVANEREHIQHTVDYAGNMEPHYLDCEGSNPYSVIDDWLDVLEMPYKFYENSFWIKGIYEQAARHDVGILLNGQRGNWTISWGPALDYYLLLLKRMKFIRFGREIRDYSLRIGGGRRMVLNSLMHKAFKKQNDQYYLPNLVNPQLAERTGVLDRLRLHGVNITGRVQSAYEVKQHQFAKLCYTNISGMYATKMSLRHQAVMRDPTNDLRVIRLCRSVPEDQYVQGGMDRSFIRRATASYLPDQVRLNQRTRGVQGADGVHRMIGEWPAFIREVEGIAADERMSSYLNMETLRHSLNQVRTGLRPELAYDLDFRYLMRSLILSRFIARTS